MRVFDLLIPKERIFGLEIQESRLRAVLLHSVRQKVVLISSGEIRLKKDTIIKGKVKDKKALILALRKLFRAAKPSIKTPYCIVSLPESLVFTQTFQFPPLPQEQITQAIKSDVSLFPYPLDKAYMDWQEVKAPNIEGKIELLIAQGPKNKIDPYLEALDEAGLIPIAFEMPSISLSRIVDKPQKGASLGIYLTQDGIVSLVFKEGDLRFGRFLSFKEEIPKVEKIDIQSDEVRKTLVNEIRRVITFYQSQRKVKVSFSSIFICGEKGKISKLAKYVTGQLQIKTSQAQAFINIKKIDFIKEDSSWLPVVGCALRGLVSRKEDNFISLLPVGTEEAYETKKRVAFASLWGNIITTLTVVLVIIFVSMWFLLHYLVQTTDEQLNLRAQIPIPEETSRLETEALEFNERIEIMKEIQKDILPFSPILAEIKNLIPEGITLNGLNIFSKEAEVILQGKADTRKHLIALKDNLESSLLFKSINMPLASIEKKENIEFNISFSF